MAGDPTTRQERQQAQKQADERRRAAEDRVTQALVQLRAPREAARSGVLDRAALKEALAEFSAARRDALEASAGCERLEAEERERARGLIEPVTATPHLRFVRWLGESGRLRD